MDSYLVEKYKFTFYNQVQRTFLNETIHNMTLQITSKIGTTLKKSKKCYTVWIPLQIKTKY